MKKRDIFNRYGAQARQVLEELLDKYTTGGISQLENPLVLQLEPCTQMGSPRKIAEYFGGRDQYYSAVSELGHLIYNFNKE